LGGETNSPMAASFGGLRLEEWLRRVGAVGKRPAVLCVQNGRARCKSCYGTGGSSCTRKGMRTCSTLLSRLHLHSLVCTHFWFPTTRLYTFQHIGRRCAGRRASRSLCFAPEVEEQRRIESPGQLPRLLLLPRVLQHPHNLQAVTRPLHLPPHLALCAAVSRAVPRGAGAGGRLPAASQELVARGCCWGGGGARQLVDEGRGLFGRHP
jgi:hypothetical protein